MINKKNKFLYLVSSQKKLVRLITSFFKLKLNKDIIIYGVGSVASSLSSFVLLPFYIRKMSVEEFGVLSLTLIVPVFITSFMSLSLEGAVMRFYYEWKDKGVEKKSIFTLWITMTIWSLIISILLFIFGGSLFNAVLKNVPFSPYIQIAIFSSFLSVTYSFVGKILRIQENAKSFVVLNYSGTILKFALIIIFINNVSSSAIGALYGILVADFVMLIPALFILNKYIEPLFFKNSIFESLKLELPALPGVILTNFAFLFDRFFLDKFFSSGEIGKYSISLKVAGIILAIMSIFQLALTPFFLKTSYQSSNASFRIGLVKGIYSDLMFVFSFMLILFSHEIIFLITKNNEPSVSLILPILISAYYFQSLIFVPHIQFYIAKKLIYTTMSTILLLVLFSLLALFLTPRFGLLGFSFAFLVTNLIVFIANEFYSKKAYFVVSKNKILNHSSILLMALLLTLSDQNTVINPGKYIFVIKLIILSVFLILYLNKNISLILQNKNFSEE